MKAITEKKWRNSPDAWGRYSDSAEQIFEVESSDTGTKRDNWRGQGHSSYTFTSSDVGKKIAVYTDKSNWTCWVFGGAQ